MSQKLKDISLSVLIRPYKGGFIGMCAETGFICEGESFEGVRKSLFNSIIALFKAVEKDESLIPSFELGLPIKYKILFYRSVVIYLVLRWWWNMKKIGSFMMQGNALQFCGMMPANG